MGTSKKRAPKSVELRRVKSGELEIVEQEKQENQRKQEIEKEESSSDLEQDCPTYKIRNRSDARSVLSQSTEKRLRNLRKEKKKKKKKKNGERNQKKKKKKKKK